ncbi:MAG TPA: hypothetical protein DCE56_40345, partial [Cyanobacteria bacterium UBA8553]|nr:hypothetical protein [Cyanobacteria bacterium UBA8553]
GAGEVREKFVPTGSLSNKFYQLMMLRKIAIMKDVTQKSIANCNICCNFSFLSDFFTNYLPIILLLGCNFHFEASW